MGALSSGWPFLVSFKYSVSKPCSSRISQSVHHKIQTYSTTRGILYPHKQYKCTRCQNPQNYVWEYPSEEYVLSPYGHPIHMGQSFFNGHFIQEETRILASWYNLSTDITFHLCIPYSSGQINSHCRLWIWRFWLASTSMWRLELDPLRELINSWLATEQLCSIYFISLHTFNALNESL